MNRTVEITLRQAIRVVFGNRCLSLKGESGRRLRYRPSEYPSLLLGMRHFEPDVRTEWQVLLRKGDVIFDVGANIGLTVDRCWSLLGGECHIWAFEPVHRNLELLRTNVGELGSDRVFIVPCALGDRDGEAEFLDNLEHGGLSCLEAVTLEASVSCDSRQQKSKFLWRHTRRTPLPVATLDAFLRIRPDVHPTFLKLDVEGAARLVIAGGRRTLETHRPVISCSFHGATERRNVIEGVTSMGYKGVRMWPGGVQTLCSPADSNGTFVHEANVPLSVIA